MFGFPSEKSRGSEAHDCIINTMHAISRNLGKLVTFARKFLVWKVNFRNKWISIFFSQFRTCSILWNFMTEISLTGRCDWSLGQCLLTSNEASAMLLFTHGFREFIYNVKGALHVTMATSPVSAAEETTVETSPTINCMTADRYGQFTASVCDTFGVYLILLLS